MKYRRFLGYLFGVTQLKESESSSEYSGVMHVAQCVHMHTFEEADIGKLWSFFFFYSSLSLLSRKLHYLGKWKVLSKQTLRQRLVPELFYFMMGYRAFHVVVLHIVITVLTSSSKGLILWHMSKCPADFPLFQTVSWSHQKNIHPSKTTSDLLESISLKAEKALQRAKGCTKRLQLRRFTSMKSNSLPPPT